MFKAHTRTYTHRSYQGWAFVGWESETQAQEIKSFVDATPPGKFNIIDMSVNGDGEWKKTNFSNFWDAKIIWTTLSNFGGTDGMRGDLERINTIPFDGPANVWVRVCIFVCLFINRV